MEMNELDLVKEIKKDYEKKEPSKVDELKKLNAKAKRPAIITSVTVGTIGTLVLGTGMCMVFNTIPGGMLYGVIIGVAGILVMGLSWILCKALLKHGKKKYAERIITLSDEILGE